MQETEVQSLGQGDPLEKEMETHSSPLAWEIPWTDKLVGCSPWGRREPDTRLSDRVGMPASHSAWLRPRQSDLGRKEKHKPSESEREEPKCLWRWHDPTREEP